MLTGPELGAAIESARIAKGVTKKKLAEDFGVKPPSVQGWVKFGRIDKNKLMEMIEYFSDVARPQHWGLDHKLYGFRYEDAAQATRLHEAIERDESPLERRKIAIQAAGDDELCIPYLKEVELPQGSGKFAIQESGETGVRFGSQLLRSKGVQLESARCVIIRGNSMTPVLRDGAIVAIDVNYPPLTDLVDGDLYAISHAGQLRVKQIFRVHTGLRLRSFNRDEYPDEGMSFQDIRDEDIKILGPVFWWGMFAR